MSNKQSLITDLEFLMTTGKLISSRSLKGTFSKTLKAKDFEFYELNQSEDLCGIFGSYSKSSNTISTLGFSAVTKS